MLKSANGPKRPLMRSIRNWRANFHPSGRATERLDALIEGADSAASAVQVTGFAIDHRKVAPGTVFGAFPGARIPSVALAVAMESETVERRLRLGQPAVIGRLADGRLLLDLRSIMPGEDDEVVDALRSAMA